MSIAINIALTSLLVFIISCFVGSFADEYGHDKIFKWSFYISLFAFAGMISSIIIAIWS